MYAVIKVKTFQGMEGQGLNAVVVSGSRPICFVLDDAHGGEVEFDFRNPEQSPRSYQSTTAESAKREEKAFGDFCLNWYASSGEKARHDEELVKMGIARKDLRPATAQEAMETWVNQQVDEIINKRRFDRAAKTSTLFRLQGDKPGEWRVIRKHPYCPQIQAWLDKKYPGKVAEIYGAQQPSAAAA